MNINRVAVRAVGAGALVAAVVGAMPSTSTAGVGQSMTGASAYAGHHHHAGMVHTTATGNKVEFVDPDQSTYIPKVLSASPRQRQRARSLLRGVNRFCSTHTVAELRAGWRRGMARDSHPTHYFNPAPGASGVDPANPRAALVYDGQVGGVMFTGQPLPYVGPIPRLHRHTGGSMMGSGSMVEMVHVYCTDDLTVKSVREAFTPDRQLGVYADTIRLRLRIRPAVMDLNPRQLRQVRDRVRSYIGRQSYQSSGRTAAGGPDPVLQAMRTEIRHGLMQLDEAQLRSIWRLMKSY